ncbi:expressed unknown protein [Seminavis robusta]|uniref:Uncharacterized protein n=1 Tax=Seminavis robusta TaxID=568900 RepID=A0A9N8DND9_9STRA|nr:expressed unknown protein [Seminavis robusta]|eukprot:Sro175_g076890.1 n/a (1390) ;mRNA; f:6572-10831
MVLRRSPVRSRSGDAVSGSMRSHHSVDSTNSSGSRRAPSRRNLMQQQSSQRSVRRGRLGRRLPKLKRSATATGRIGGVFRSMWTRPSHLGNQSASGIHNNSSDCHSNNNSHNNTQTNGRHQNKNELNIFCSDVIVSTEFTLSRMAYARQTTCITKLELEDLIERHDQTLFLEVRDLMIADKRPWEYVRFVDHLYEFARYERYLELKQQLWRLVEDDVRQLKIPLQFQAILELQRGSTVATAISFLQRIHNCPDLEKIEFSGAMFGYLPLRIPTELRTLCQHGYVRETVVLKVSFTVPEQVTVAAARFVQQNATAVAMDTSSNTEQTPSELWDVEGSSKELGDYSVSVGKARSVKLLAHCIVTLQQLQAEQQHKKEEAQRERELELALRAGGHANNEGEQAQEQQLEEENKYDKDEESISPRAIRRSSLSDLDRRRILSMMDKKKEQGNDDAGDSPSKTHRKSDDTRAPLRRTRTMNSVDRTPFRRTRTTTSVDQWRKHRKLRRNSMDNGEEDDDLDCSEKSRVRRRPQRSSLSQRRAYHSDDDDPHRRRFGHASWSHKGAFSFSLDDDVLDQSDNYHVRRRRQRHSGRASRTTDDLDQSDNFHVRRRRQRHSQRASMNDLDQSDNFHVRRRRQQRKSLRRNSLTVDDLDKSDNYHVRRRRQTRTSLKRSSLSDEEEPNAIKNKYSDLFRNGHHSWSHRRSVLSDDDDDDVLHKNGNRQLQQLHSSWSHKRSSFILRDDRDDDDNDLDDSEDYNGHFFRGHTSWSPSARRPSALQNDLGDGDNSFQTPSRKSTGRSRARKKEKSRRNRPDSQTFDETSSSSTLSEGSDGSRGHEKLSSKSMQDEGIITDTELLTDLGQRPRRRSSFSEMEGQKEPCFDWEDLRLKNSQEEEAKQDYSPPKLRRTKTMPLSLDRRRKGLDATQQQSSLSKPDVDVAVSREKLSSMRKGLQHSLSQMRLAEFVGAAESSDGVRGDGTSRTTTKKNERISRSKRVQRHRSIDGSVTRTRLHPPPTRTSLEKNSNHSQSANGSESETATNRPQNVSTMRTGGRTPRRGAAIKLQRSKTLDGNIPTNGEAIKAQDNSQSNQTRPNRKKKKSLKRSKSSGDDRDEPVAPWMSLVNATISLEKKSEASEPLGQSQEIAEEDPKEHTTTTKKEEPIAELSSCTTDALIALESQIFNNSISILDLFGVEASDMEQDQKTKTEGKATTPDASFANDSNALSASTITMENSLSSMEGPAADGDDEKETKKLHKSLSVLELSPKSASSRRKKNKAKRKRRLTAQPIPVPMVGPLAPQRFCNSMASSLDNARFNLSESENNNNQSGAIETLEKQQEFAQNLPPTTSKKGEALIALESQILNHSVSMLALFGVEASDGEEDQKEVGDKAVVAVA